ncbi:hypothetical protein JOB18_031697 [Solea senegalensis]|uniref:Enolase 4 n=2 Tax=Solea senegalensis TaxID=28829 RepID=A0AAV6PHB2_SOLSE|nr:hypothetical protein JOB18_031697 [Solea senegalensis]KAG7462381.1 hypothetical protein JOB18_031697 [Solea senegalensis]
MSSREFLRRLSEEERELYEKKVAAAEFYRRNRIPEEIEKVLNQLFLLQPADIHGYMANYFANLSAPPRINRLKGWEVYDTRGQLSVEVEVFCIIQNKEQSMCSASVSSCFGLKETSEDWRAKADHVMTAVQWIKEPLNCMLKDQNPCDQSQVDQTLSNFIKARYQEEEDRQKKKKEEEEEEEKEECGSASSSEVLFPPSPPAAPAKDKKSADKGKKNSVVEKPLPPAEPPEPVLPGSLAIGSLSLAVAKTGAKLKDVPLYRYIAALREPESPAQFHIPTCLVTLLSCGKTSPGKLSLMEEVILIPKVGQRVKQIITMTSELQKEMMRIMNTSTKAGAAHVALHESGAPAVSFERPEQPLELIAEACANLGLELGKDFHLAVNCAARQLVDYSKGKYEVSAGVLKSPDELVDMYHVLISKNPAVVALIDPIRKEDKDQWEKLRNVIGNTCSLLCDTTYESKAPPPPGVTGHILKHVHDITVSDLVRITSERRGSVLMGPAVSPAAAAAAAAAAAVTLWPT